MADISQVTLSDGSVVNFKDATAREAVSSAASGLTGKLDKAQGAQNAGKMLKVGNDGVLQLVDPDSGTGDVVGPSSSVDSQVAVFDGTTGKLIKDSGKTLGKSVPSDAVFTDTTYESKTAVEDGTAESLVTTGEKYAWNNKIDSSEKGVASGVAELDQNGKVPSSQLPSYVDDVLEYNGVSSFPLTGETGKIYVDTSTNKTYRWGGSSYVEISESLALGETDSTAYRGDRGKTAYDHASAKGSAYSSGLYKITTNAEGHVTAATAVQKSDITALGIPGDSNTPVDQNPTIQQLGTTYAIGSVGNITFHAKLADILKRKTSNVDFTKSDNDVQANTILIPEFFNGIDKNDKVGSRIGTLISSNGDIGTAMLANNYDSDSGSIKGSNHLYVSVDKEGNAKYEVASPSAFRTAIGAGTSSSDHTYAVVSKAKEGLCPILPNETTTTKYLRQDGSWVVPPNDNTTYAITNYNPALEEIAKTYNVAKIGDQNISVQMPATGFAVKISNNTDFTKTDNGNNGSWASYGGIRFVDAENSLTGGFLGGEANSLGESGLVGISLSAKNYNTSGASINENYIKVLVDKNANAVYRIKDPAAFRTAIGAGTSSSNTTYSFTDKNPTLAWGTTSTIGVIAGGASANFRVTMPANPNTNTTYSFTDKNPTLSWGSTSTIGVIAGGASANFRVTMPANPNTTYAFTNKAPTLAWNTTSTVGVAGGVAFTVKMPANPNTTYAFSNSAPTLAWNTTSTVGVAGGVAFTVKMPANPNSNTTYSFTDKNPTLAWGSTSTIGVIGGGASANFRATMPANPTKCVQLYTGNPAVNGTITLSQSMNNFSLLNIILHGYGNFTSGTYPTAIIVNSIILQAGTAVDGNKYMASFQRTAATTFKVISKGSALDNMYIYGIT